MSHALRLFVGVLLIAMHGPVMADDDRLQRIRTAQTLRVCIWPDYYGISFRNPKTLQLSGIDADLARELARDLGVEAEFVDSAFASLIEDVLGDRCDIAMFAIGITPARQQHLRFTQPYLASDIYAITTRTNRRIRDWSDIDQPGTVVAVAKGTLHEAVMREKLQHAELRVLDTPHSREQEVQSGRADIFMTDYAYSRRMLDNHDWARLVSPTQSDQNTGYTWMTTPGIDQHDWERIVSPSASYHLTPYAWAMAPGDDAFHARVERFITAIKTDGRLLEAARRHGLEPIVVH
ncbi:ABC transporter substrate-binding protein [Allochromatium vinosum]|uniref:Extracellular solute-binding protein family 3 n=1 Tax=Allochromatium vinosum (strain ATCC 17899 / DSM 180 / NBRC 103801 / NCIMB 10441 / D) TaxID=572477 RepID=D3RQU2_ALLVD|nr:ABC transporter substrate-binding protein [Allochromatium vinosum]ADC63776.1 extracellular solute-binding protein family 3 [Allochromatium vinosum DSM 180]